MVYREGICLFPTVLSLCLSTVDMVRLHRSGLGAGHEVRELYASMVYCVGRLRVVEGQNIMYLLSGDESGSRVFLQVDNGYMSMDD